LGNVPHSHLRRTVTHELIHPNWHVVIMHAPLGLLMVGTLIEIFSFMWRRSGFRAAGRWMILIGALAAIPTATTGIYAARDVLSDELYPTWQEIKAHPKLDWTGQQGELLRDHIKLNAIAVGI